ncbi:recombinase family protein [Streptomyces sp. NPDC057430]|uniref:recombinase family protein n=1 Tax=unclassified Streptomyces TaxID=2593676 RepID=UPI0036C2ADE0
MSRQGVRQLADVVELVEDTGVRFVSLKDNLDSANPGRVSLASFLAEQAKEEAKNIQLRVAARQLLDRRRGRCDLECWTRHRRIGRPSAIREYSRIAEDRTPPAVPPWRRPYRVIRARGERRWQGDFASSAPTPAMTAVRRSTKTWTRVRSWSRETL